MEALKEYGRQGDKVSKYFLINENLKKDTLSERLFIANLTEEKERN